jgi:replicative DNA helicase
MANQSQSQGYRRQSASQKIVLQTNTFLLDRIILALLQYANNRRFVANVSKLFSLIDDNDFRNDADKDLRVYIIRKVLDALLSNDRLVDKTAIMNTVDMSGRLSDQAITQFSVYANQTIDDNDLKNIDQTVSQKVKYGIVISKSDKLVNLIDTVRSESYDDLETEMTKIEDTTSEFSRDLREARESADDTKNEVDLSDQAFTGALSRVIAKQANPSNKIKTGIKAMNEMLDGGYESGRLYVAMGMAKGWKSGYLLNSACWAKLYNTISPKDPMKRPCIVMISLENSVDETIIRLGCYANGNDFNIAQHSSDAVAQMLRSAKLYTPDDPASPDLIIMYKPPKSICVDDIKSILDDLSKEGKECVFLIIDYLKRIRPNVPNKNGEVRLDLGSITDDLCALAKSRDIPVLTAMQLNRDAFKEYEQADDLASKTKAVYQMGASNVGESIDIVQNTDYAFIINRTVVQNHDDAGHLDSVDRILNVKLIACRGKQPDIMQFSHPFATNNDLRLDEDINCQGQKSFFGDANTEIMVRQNLISAGAPQTRGARHIIPQGPIGVSGGGNKGPWGH